MIRKAMVEDVGSIHKILGYFAAKGLLLPRPLSELYEHLRDFFVLEDNSRNHRIVGVCALGICWDKLAEIRSLAVIEKHQGKKFGSQLVDACLQEARSLGLSQVFVLTYLEDFFSRLGFELVEKATLPHKVWADCLKCPKFPDCDESAMILKL
ncbi:MAG: N-acetyltransferase [Deltaproteobacteria bacterium]|nr:N-acetyltransferase [Deltaproteobacteria bacterium]MBW1918905.1 N-acetyltransferase [Deltaproteobacteria bacterium]MBW1934719.1 N-acetyltransferase [Deltaproteobacteria bacterium]MBW1976966.1 N-acetyltransferase [Deltaproteobacteria bacterium]MBW2044686.1 N-acetyltransferase [Deltaproteobacteria bacterium]